MSDHTPASGQPEYLTQGGGQPMATPPPPPRSGSGARKGVIAAGVVLAAVVAGGGVWAYSFFSQGSQPAEALPAGTLGYASVDLDPAGGQKIEAFEMLRKFPAFKEQVGLDANDDLKEKIFDEAQKSGECPDLDYADDIEPWLGDRFAVAAVDTGEEQPTPVMVIQVKDGSAADVGLKKIQACSGDDSSGGWVIEGDWAVVGETQAIAQKVTDETDQGTLASDSDYQKWTGEIGDAGVVNMYAAPEAGEYLARMSEEFSSMAQGMSSSLDPNAGATGELPPAAADALKDFPGMAMTLRFSDGALELAAAGGTNAATSKFLGGGSVETIDNLPDDTAAALGLALGDGWAQGLLDNMAGITGMSGDELAQEMEAETGLTTDDLETLLGSSASLSLSSDFDAETFFNSSDGSDVPVGLKVKGDASAVQGVLGKIASSAGPDAATVLGNDANGDTVAIGPNPDYRKKLLEDGSLGDTDEFQNLVPHADEASMVFFVNFNAGDWLTNLAGDDAEAKDNLEPLQGIGMSAWQSDDASHFLLRLTTD